MKSSGELCNELDRYAAEFTVAAMVFEWEGIDLVWSNETHRQCHLESLVARGARLLGGVGVNINPEYRVLAEAERASAEDVLKDVATAIQLDAMEGITFCEIETSQSGDEN
jgi:hypothetical protein